MPRPHRLALIAGLIAMLAAACSSNGAGSTATPAPSPSPAPSSTAAGPGTPVTDAPPSVTVAPPGAGVVEMRVGSYCWGGLCADAIGILTPATAITAAAGAELEFGGEAFAVAPAGSSFQLWPVPTAPVDAQEDWQAWQPQSDPITLDVVNARAVLPGDLAPGTYLAALFLNYAAGGDGSYGILIDITP